MANLYFLFIGLLQMVKEISISEGVPTIYLPLVTIVAITAAKDYYEDYKRKKSDREENQSRCTVLREGVFVSSQWQNLRVGDVVKIKQNQFFPADLLILNTTEPKGMCYVETKGLDGETNLKPKQCQKDLFQYFLENNKQKDFDESVFNRRKIIFGYEQPNALLEKFDGYVKLPDFKDLISISNKNFLLRGCSLRNTKYLYGLVANTGHDTKIQKNSFNARAKRSRLESIMSSQILLIFLIQMIICCFCSIYFITYRNSNKEDQGYLMYDDQSNAFLFFQKFGNWLLIFGNFVPISLLFTLEFVKFFQAIYIMYDDGSLDAKYKPNQQGMIYNGYAENGEKIQFKTQAQSSNLNEELGQIEYIFSDKTGTLTRNVMQFKKISINGISYGEVEEGDPDYITDEMLKEFPKVQNVDFRDMSLIRALQNPDHSEHKYVIKTLAMIALTHTVIISEEQDIKDPKKTIKQYNASSPDELALVNFAKFCGVEYMGVVDDDEDDEEMSNAKENNEDDVVISICGKLVAFKLLEVFEFDSTRKRQSVIIKDPETGKIKLLCKGADSVILKHSDRLNCQKIPEVSQHLEEYSLIGLRTLLLSEKEIDVEVYKEWKEGYKRAQADMHNREEKTQQFQQELEQDLIVIGATAIEDQLQDEVGETIYALKQAGIKVWVLTGDKVETARNIGYSCKLLSPSIAQHRIQLKGEALNNDELAKELVKQQLKTTYTKIIEENEKQLAETNELNTQNALIITGEALAHITDPDLADILINITMYCEAVLCCRVSPLQKQQIVSLVRKNNKSVSTLAIGDGANDVNMITAAHVGIGIKGLEGQQATRASDYAIGEFKLLRRLLFFHGREAYRRNSRLVCYNFYKNIVVVVPQFWFAFNNFFAGQTLYEPYMYQIYNVFYTSMPIMVYAIMDLEFNPSVLMENIGNYYLPGIKHFLFNEKVFWQWFINGFCQAFIINFVCFYSLQTNFTSSDGYMLDFWASGTMVMGLVVLIANFKVFIISFDHTVFSVIFNIGSIIMFYLSFITLSNLNSSVIDNLFQVIMASPNYHLGNLLGVVAVCLCIDFASERWIRGQAQSIRETLLQERLNEQKLKLSKSQLVK
ncbi:P-type ATPase, cytoplasmic domain N [Pseudocohnilembus persalinus]|uniref:Phospholipid-transporting ATPase n=1 Tax=Pseudocohnilembus persalinus TaxID=266149 RepID=A0A0V0R3X6_PSEPJ|nr:P-type ATPase, cytoplasmic domain N [Pseudocohnilembus persalinus]|eukprot:KRX09193.1 P-type ATPase, cytoplasmic domain N [Pseudocohnilembus persalinus]